MRGLPHISSLSHNEFNKFNNTGAQITDFTHMSLKVLYNRFMHTQLTLKFAIYKRGCYDGHYVMVQHT